MAGVIGEYGEFFGQVARQVSEPVDFVMTVKEMAEGSITPEEAAINLATMGHGHLAESVERTAVQAVEKSAIGAAKQKAVPRAGSSTSEASATGSSRPPDPEGDRPPPEAKPRPVTRQDIMREVEKAMLPHIETMPIALVLAHRALGR